MANDEKFPQKVLYFVVYFQSDVSTHEHLWIIQFMKSIKKRMYYN